MDTAKLPEDAEMAIFPGPIPALKSFRYQNRCNAFSLYPEAPILFLSNQSPPLKSLELHNLQITESRLVDVTNDLSGSLEQLKPPDIPLTRGIWRNFFIKLLQYIPTLKHILVEELWGDEDYIQFDSINKSRPTVIDTEFCEYHCHWKHWMTSANEGETASTQLSEGIQLDSGLVEEDGNVKLLLERVRDEHGFRRQGIYT